MNTSEKEKGQPKEALSGSKKETLLPDVACATVDKERTELQSGLLQKEELPPLVERIERQPILQETVIPREVEEIQPVIHREREQLEIKEITQPIFEKVLLSEQTQEITLASKIAPTIKEDDAEVVQHLERLRLQQQPTVERQEPIKECVTQPPVVIETIKKHIVEEIQPIIYKETIEPHVIKEIQPIFEKVIEKPVITQEVLSPIQIHHESEIPEIIHHIKPKEEQHKEEQKKKEELQQQLKPEFHEQKESQQTQQQFPNKTPEAST